MTGKCYVLITGIIFCLVSVMHLLRVLYHVPVQIGGWLAPEWISWLGFIGPGILSIWAFRIRASCDCKDDPEH